MNGKKKKTSIGFAYAWNGLLELWRTEKNFKVHCIASIIVFIVSFLLRLSIIEWSIILLTIGMVFVTEAFNTAVERLIDYLRPEKHPLAGFIKDVAAGGVLIAVIMSVVIGILIFMPKIIALC